MKWDEKIAQKWLKSQGYTNIKFEPDGNVPPDFSLNNIIGIEVRRLNQHLNKNGNNIPIEDLEFKLIPRIRTFLKQIKNKNYTNSIFLSIRYNRPLKVDKVLLGQIKEKILLNIEILNKELTFEVNDNLELKLFRSDLKLEDYIQIGSYSDRDSGGFIVSIIYENLSLILSEKDEKIRNYRNKYNFWWLLLIDRIGYGLDGMDIKQLNELPRLTTYFDKVVLVSPIDISKSYEISIKKSNA